MHEIEMLIKKRLPKELINYIYEFIDPDISITETKIQELLKNIKIDKNNGIYTPYIQRNTKNGCEIIENCSYDPSYLLEKSNIAEILIMMKVIKLIYKKSFSKKKWVSECEKDFIECVFQYNYHLTPNTLSYIYRGNVVLAFILLGYDYDIVNSNNCAAHCKIYACKTLRYSDLCKNNINEEVTMLKTSTQMRKEMEKQTKELYKKYDKQQKILVKLYKNDNDAYFREIKIIKDEIQIGLNKLRKYPVSIPL